MTPHHPAHAVKHTKTIVGLSEAETLQVMDVMNTLTPGGVRWKELRGDHWRMLARKAKRLHQVHQAQLREQR
jgi:hypothetical protein